MDFKPPFGAWLKARRIEQDVTRGTLARRLGYSPETIRKVEAGALKPSRQIATLLAKHLGVPESQRDAFVAFASGGKGEARSGLGNLPAPVTPLIGCRAEVTAVLKLLRRNDVRLVTLVGPPGVGKTRLSIEVAREVCGDYADGALFIELAAITEPSTALASIAHAAHIDVRHDMSLLSALQDGLRERHLLLVLDNLEQVLDVGPFVGQLLSAAPRLTVLATSRELLRTGAEHGYTVPSLAQGDGGWRSAATELFSQRARAVKPEFRLDQTTGRAVAGICRKLDGLPLSIELAAARTVLFTPVEILARMEQGLPVLIGGARDLPERHRTLSATLDWSYALLTPDEQALFRRLGVFAGGCTLHAAQTMCDVDELALEAEDGLAALTAKSLIARTDSADGGSRYSMLQTIRAYALDQLRMHGEWDAWHEQLAEYLSAMRTFVSSTKSRFSVDVDNWRAAMAWAISAGRIGDLAPALALLHAHDDYGVGWPEQIAWLESILAHPHIERHPAAHAQALALLGETEAMQGELTRAVHHLELGAALCKRHDLKTELIEMLFSLGMARRGVGDTARAISDLREAIRLCHELGYAERIPHLLITQALTEVIAEDGAQALRLVDEAFALGGKDVTFLHAWGLISQAHALHLLGDWAGARAQAQRGLELFHQHNPANCLEHAWSHLALAEIALSEADATTALRNGHKVLEISDFISEKWIAAWGLVTLAGVAASDNDAGRGAALWGAGEALRERVGCHIGPASRLNHERTVALLREQLGEAEFARLTTEGAQMTLDEAMACAPAATA